MKNKIIRLITIIVIILIVVDQMSKIIVNKFVTEPIGNEYFSIDKSTNTGMALGFNEGNGSNIFTMIFVLALIINFIRKQIERIDTRTAIALSLVLAGGISNLIDRIFRARCF